MITLTTVNWLHEADALCARLASCGIAAKVPDQNTVTVLPIYGGVLGGIRIQVEEPDLERAKEIMQDMVAESKEPAIHCPACQSASVIYRRAFWPFFALIILFFGLPLLWLRKTYMCRSCGRHWKEARPVEQ